MKSIRVLFNLLRIEDGVAVVTTEPATSEHVVRPGESVSVNMTFIPDETVDHRELLRKYMAHVVQAEGPGFATNFARLSPCDMGEDNFTAQELRSLEEIGKEVSP